MESIYSQTRLEHPESVRLLHIEKVSSDGQVDVSLQVARLDDRPHYHALSYTWLSPFFPGSDVSSIAIRCNGRSFTILQNLHEALCVLGSSKYCNELFWIDAICIDQDSAVDPAEKSNQVQMMPIIFALADRVVIWLGPEHDGTESALHLIRKLGSLKARDRQKIRPSALQDTTVQQLLGNGCNHIDSWKALARFFCRSWFRRAWVIQEVLHASALTVLCGTHHISWDNLVSVSDLISTTEWNPMFMRPEFTGISSAKPHPGGPAKLRATRYQKNFGTEETLLISLIRGRGYTCQDPRDKIFSLASTSKRSIRVDYGLSVGAVYAECAHLILQVSNDLLLLSYAEGEDYRSEHTKNAPSWVPDWSVASVVGLGITGYKRYAAAGNRERGLQIHAPAGGGQQSAYLEVEAEFVDVIDVVGEKKSAVLQGHSCMTWLELLCSLDEQYMTGETSFDALWRVLITNTAKEYPAPVWLRNSFVHWLVGVCQSYASTSDLETRQALSQCLSVLLRRWSVHHGNMDVFTGNSEEAFEEPLTLSVDRHEADRFATYYHHTLCLRLLGTEKGLLGVGTTSLRRGDSIYLVYGSRIPLIFRPCKDDRRKAFTLVGGCYAHGIMNSEALGKSSTEIIRVR